MPELTPDLTHETQDGGATDEGFDMTSSVYEREDETITLNVYRI